MPDCQQKHWQFGIATRSDVAWHARGHRFKSVILHSVKHWVSETENDSNTVSFQETSKIVR